MSLHVPESFLREEEREGFVISPMMKRAWAAQMKLLSLMAEIFKRHGLTWWMDYGSLLGTVRHRGYTPWDDDIDISMPRLDYERGLKALREELPPECLVRKIEFSYLIPWAVVSNRGGMDTGDDPAQRAVTEAWFDFPYICNIDVYPLDYIPRDPAAREYFYRLMQVVDGTAYYYHEYKQAGTLEGWLENVEEGSGRTLPRDRDCQVDLYYLLDELSQAYADRKDESCGLAMVDEWACRGRQIRPLECYERTVRLPYEMMEVPVPAGYEKMLAIEYGSWTTPVRGSTHDYPFYGKQEELLKRMKSVNEKKIAFILCVNDQAAFSICRWYLDRLVVPDGMEAELIPVEDAPSMCGGYNRAGELTDAKYKVYLHQDTLILNRYFIENMLILFADHPDAGMIGMVGSERLSDTGVMWRGKRTGNQYLPDDGAYAEERIESGHPVTCAECVDGFLMATSADIPWREDLLDGWDFYDASQSMEYRRAGFRILVPHQTSPWCLHNDGRVLTLLSYDRYRQIFLKEYGAEVEKYACIPGSRQNLTPEDEEYLKLLGELASKREELYAARATILDAVDAALKNGDRQALIRCGNLFSTEPGRTALVRFSELLKLSELLEAVKAEETLGLQTFADGVGSLSAFFEKLQHTEQALRVIEFGFSSEETAEALCWLRDHRITAYSAAAMIYGMTSLLGHREQLLLKMAEDALDAGEIMQALQFITVIREPSPETSALKEELTTLLTGGAG